MFYHCRQLNNAILYLILLLLVTASVYGRQASTECARKASALRDVDLMDQPPTYSAKNGWVYGNRICLRTLFWNRVITAPRSRVNRGPMSF